jgi:hypothetical protein
MKAPPLQTPPVIKDVSRSRQVVLKQFEAYVQQNSKKLPDEEMHTLVKRCAIALSEHTNFAAQVSGSQNYKLRFSKIS